MYILQEVSLLKFEQDASEYQVYNEVERDQTFNANFYSEEDTVSVKFCNIYCV